MGTPWGLHVARYSSSAVMGEAHMDVKLHIVEIFQRLIVVPPDEVPESFECVLWKGACSYPGRGHVHACFRLSTSMLNRVLCCLPTPHLSLSLEFLAKEHVYLDSSQAGNSQQAISVQNSMLIFIFARESPWHKLEPGHRKSSQIAALKSYL